MSTQSPLVEKRVSPIAVHDDWPRYLVPRDGGIVLDSVGFMRDPSEEFGQPDNPDVLRPSVIADLPVVVPLGEPGMGKTALLNEAYDAALCEERHAVRSIWQDSGARTSF